MQIGEEGRAPLKEGGDWLIAYSLTRAWKGRVKNQFLEKLQKKKKI